MNRRKIKKKCLSVLSVLALALTMLAGFPAAKAYAASGNVYTCTINRCYAHPVTGVIEDSGGEASYATGQGMVEGCVYSGGILEVTDDGAYYLTIRMSLMDYTSGHSFLVQNVGDSDWTAPSEIGVTANGTDSNGTTADVCMRVPSENCIVRGTMYVEPMGRNVVFYVYPSDYSEGNNTDMNATIVTSASGTDNSGNGSDSNNTYTGTSGDASADNTASDNNAGSQSGSQASGSSSLQSSTGSQSSGNSSLQSGTGNDKTGSGDSDKAAESESETGSAPKLQSSITQAAAPAASSGTGTDSSTLNSAEGLSLSTAQDVSNEENASADAARTSGSSAFQIGLAITIAGLILIAVGAGVVYFFRRNWRRWGGGEDDEEE